MKAAALRGALSDRARDGRIHVVTGAGRAATTPSTKAAIAAARQDLASASTCSWSSSARDDARLEVACATSPQVHLLVAGPAEHLRRARLRRRGLHPGRARVLPRWPDRPARAPKAVASRAEPRATAEDAGMSTIADPRDILLAPVVSEKSYGLLDENKYTFLVAPGRQQDPDQDRGRAGLRRQGHRASTRSTARASASAPGPASASARTPSARS